MKDSHLIWERASHLSNDEAREQAPRKGAYRGKERRRFGRREIFCRAEAVLSGHPRMGCRIFNVSEAGAFLVFDEPIVPRQTFRVLFCSGRFSIRCEVIHGDDSGVGVTFLDVDVGRRLIEFLCPRPLGGKVGPTDRPTETGGAGPASK